jgi:hypothetical protein
VGSRYGYYLTGPIAAQIAANFSQTSGDNTVELGVITAAIGVIGTLAGVYFTNRFNLGLEKWKFKTNEIQKKKDVYSELTGKRPLMKQHYMTLGKSKILRKYYAKLLGVPDLRLLRSLNATGNLTPQDIIKDEFDRWEEKANDASDEIARDNESLSKLLGAIQISFPTVPNRLINDLSNTFDTLNQKISQVEVRIGDLPLDNLREKVTAEENGWKTFVNAEFCTRIDDLIRRVREELR